MAAGFFDNEDEKIEAYESSAKAKAEAEKSASVSSSDSVETPPATPTGGKTGRPRTAQNREVFTIKPLTTVKDKIKLQALLHKCTSSDIVDALTEQFLDKLDWEQIGRYS